MKRTPLKRKTPLKAKVRLKRTPFKRKANRNEIPLLTRKLVALRSHGRCEIRAQGCRGAATDMHHIRKRVTRDHSPGNILHTCRWCHGWVHVHPLESYENGWMQHAN